MTNINIKKLRYTLFLIAFAALVSGQSCTSPQDNCLNFTIPLTNTTGTLSYGIPSYNGVQLTDYEIEWLDEDGNVAFVSAGGSFYDPNIHEAHPPIDPDGIPLASGEYQPNVLQSNIQGIVSCPPPVQISPYECTGETQTITYEGVPDVTRYIEIAWSQSPSCQLEIDFEDFTLVDNYIVYGVDASDNQTPIYDSAVSGEDVILTPDASYTDILVEISSVAGQNTQWIFRFNCCYVQELCDCDAIEYDLEVSEFIAECESCGIEVTTSINGESSCDFINDIKTFEGVGVCNSTFSDLLECENFLDNVQMSIVNGLVTIDFTDNSDYNAFKNFITNTFTTDSDIIFQMLEFPCGNDQVSTAFVISSNYNVITYDDVNSEIIISYPDLDLPCEGCVVNSVLYENILLGGLNGTYSISSYIPVIYNSVFQTNNNPEIFVFNPNVLNCAEGTSVPIRWTRLQFQDPVCPCESWQLYEDTTGDGNYDTLIDEAPNWAGTCQ